MTPSRSRLRAPRHARPAGAARSADGSPLARFGRHLGQEDQAARVAALSYRPRSPHWTTPPNPCRTRRTCARASTRCSPIGAGSPPSTCRPHGNCSASYSSAGSRSPRTRPEVVRFAGQGTLAPLIGCLAIPRSSSVGDPREFRTCPGRRQSRAGEGCAPACRRRSRAASRRRDPTRAGTRRGP